MANELITSMALSYVLMQQDPQVLLILIAVLLFMLFIMIWLIGRR